MLIKSISDKGKLIKGHIYQVSNLINAPNNLNYFNGKVRLSIGFFDVQLFRDLNGKPLPKINYNAPIHYINDVEVGDIVEYIGVTNKNLKKGNFYKIKDKNLKNRSVRLEGISYWYGFNNSSQTFRKLDKGELRELRISTLMGGSKLEICKTPISKEKNAKKYAALCILKALDDNTRHTPAIDWAKIKISKKLNTNLKDNDIETVLNMSLREIINLFE